MVKPTPFKDLSINEKKVLSLLHKGSTNSIKADNIAKITGIPRRDVFDIISTLRIKEHYPIGSNRGINAGIYLISSKEEQQRTVAILESQIKKMNDAVYSIKEANI